MALVRILVDGFSLLHAWPELAPGRPRHSVAARDELIHVLTRYADSTQIPLTIVFDGAGQRGSSGENLPSSRGIEVLFSKAGQTADQLIERVAYRMKPYGEILAVTDDHAERDTVISLGGLAASCETFIRIEQGMEDMGRDIAHYNSREKSRYKRA